MAVARYAPARMPPGAREALLNERLPLSIEDGVGEFLADLRAQGRSGTAQSYGHVLKPLLALDSPLASLSSPTIRELLAQRSLVLQPSSLRNTYYVLAALFRFCVDRGYLHDSPLRGISVPRARKPPHRFLEPHELRAMYAAARDDDDRLILLLCGGAGLRAGELLGLTARDIDLATRRITVTGKGRKRAELSIDPLACDVLARQPGVLRLHSKDAVRRRVQVLGKRARITRPVTTHMLRHSFAVGWLTETGDAASLQSLLRHESPVQTNWYVRTVRESAALRKQAEVNLTARLFGDTPAVNDGV